MSFPRRMSLNLMTPAELAIYNAIQEIEKIGADVRLTDAVNMLSKVKDLVSDFIDGVKPNPTDVNGDEVKGNDFAIREDIANILRDNITFAPQVGDYVIHGAIEKIIQYFSKLEPKAAAPKATAVNGDDDPFPLKDVLRILSNAAKILLRKKDYDGPDYEEMEICIKRAEEIIFLQPKAAAPKADAVNVDSANIERDLIKTITLFCNYVIVNGFGDGAITEHFVRTWFNENKDGYRIDKILSEYQPKAAAPKAVKSAKDILCEEFPVGRSPMESWVIKRVLNAMEEYANQFKSQA